jgi:hypothetical protein
MSYTIALGCGCEVYVACDPLTRLAHTRIIDRHSLTCPVRSHEVGKRLHVWELLSPLLEREEDEHADV